MCAGTVVDPPGETSASTASITSRSRSVALRLSLDLSARISTLARMGMVLRRSTTRWTRPSDFNNAVRSTVTFISQPVRSGGNQPLEPRSGGQRPNWPQQQSTPRGGSKGDAPGRNRQGRRRAPPPFFPAIQRRKGLATAGEASSVLQLPLQNLDFLGQRRVIAHEVLDLAHRMQDGGVIASAEAAPDLRQRTQRQRLGEIHGHLARANDIGRA